MRAGLYARVSREEQAKGYSIETQLASMHHYCQERGWEAVEYSEPGHTARTDDRPIFQELMAAAAAGQLDVVMVHRLDRAFRNLEDQLRDLRRLRELDVAFVSVKEGFDDSSSHGRLTQNIKGSINQYYSDLLSEKIRDGKAARARSGRTNASTLPYGYRLKKSIEEVGSQEVVTHAVVIDWLQAAAVILAFETYAGGLHTGQAIADLLNERGFRAYGRKQGTRPPIFHWTQGAALKLLSNPYYAGWVQHGGELYEGKHEAIVSRELFDQVQKIKRERKRIWRGGRRASGVYLLHKIAYCSHCGDMMHMEFKRMRGQHVYQYYRCAAKLNGRPCTAAGRTVPMAVIDEQMGELIKRLKLPEDWRERLAELAEQPEEHENLEGRRRYLKDKLKRLRDLYLEGDYSKGEYDRHKAELQRQLDDLREPEQPAVEQAGVTLETLADVWGGAPLQVRRDMLRTIFEKVIVDVDARRLVSVKPWPPFAVLFRMDGMRERDGYFYVGEQEAGSEG